MPLLHLGPEGRTARRTLLAVLVLLALLASACGGAKHGSADGGAIDAGSTPRDAGPVPMVFTYTPAGCADAVSTPPVLEAGMGQDVFGSDATPRHVHVGWAGPTDTTFTLNWQTDEATLASDLVFGTDQAMVQAADGATASVHLQHGHYMLYPAAPFGTSAVRNHEVHVCGLTAGTRYFYKVGGQGHWSPVLDTATGPAPGDSAPFSFAVAGDSRNNMNNAWPVVEHRIADRGVDFEVYTGDAVFLGALQSDWDTFFEAADGSFAVTDLLAHVPLMPVNGNHEVLSVPYLAQFSMPQVQSPGEGAQGEEWYSFDYGDAHFVMLNDTVTDDGVIAGAEADWLRADLGAVDRSQTPWVFVAHHRLFYTCMSTHPPDMGLRQAWQPIFDDLGVDFVLGGHNHVYERSKPIRGLAADGSPMLAAAGPDDTPVIGSDGTPSGTLYVLTGAAGAPLYDVSDTCNFTHTARAVPTYGVFQLDGRTVTFTAYDAMSDAVIDTFSYTK